MSLVDLLTPPLLPQTHPITALLKAQLRALILPLLASVDQQTGAWRLVLSQPGTREGNYIESSGTSMFIYALLKAVRLGLVADSDGKIVAAARKAYQYLLREQVVVMKDGSLGLMGTVRVGSLE
jgi:rhamnogalacturonyl hydrolase YesR